MIAFNIQWDTTDDVFDNNAEDCILPNEVEIPDSILADCTNDNEVCDEIVNYLSNEYGFLVFGYDLK